MIKKLKNTVTAFIFYDNKLLLVKNKKNNVWMHVGGHAEKNETLDETLRREVKEEVNLNIEFLEKFSHFGKNKKDLKFKELPCPFYIHSNDSSDGSHRKMCFDFVCVAKNISKLKILKKEIEDYKWFTKDEIKKFKLNKEIKILALKAFTVYKKIKKLF